MISALKQKSHSLQTFTVLRPTKCAVGPRNVQAAVGGPLKDGDALLTSRRAVERLAPFLRFTIAGVTFENRQAHVSQLRRGQALMLLQDPNNKFDENAVSIRTLRGIDLGYVPRDFTEQLRGQGLHFARVLSIGQNEAQKWGAKIGTFPTLLSCASCPMPLPTDPLQSQLDPGSPFFAEALSASRSSCEVTGVSQTWLTQPLQPLPCWQYDFVARKIRLLRLTSVSQMVMKCREGLHAPPGTQEFDEAVDLACSINSWTKEDMLDHLAWVNEESERIAQEGDWSLQD